MEIIAYVHQQIGALIKTIEQLAYRIRELERQENMTSDDATDIIKVEVFTP